MSDINIYENQAAIDALTPVSGDLVVDRGTSTLHLCTGTSPVTWKIFNPDSNAFNIDEDTEANILASSVTNPTGEVQIRYGTDTEDLYVYSGAGSTWYKFSEDGTV